MEPTTPQTDALSPFAVCPEHPERASIAPCKRCGRFLCEACLASRTPPRCSACDARSRDPLGMLAQPFALVESLSNGWKLFSRTFPQLVPIALLMSIPSGLLSYAIESNGVLQLFDATIGLISVGAYLALMVGVAEGAPSGVGAALEEGVRVWPRLFGTRFRSGLWILLFTLLLIVPGIMKALSLAVATEAAYRERQSDALENSTQLTAGRRWELFGLFVLCYVIVLMSVLLFSFIGTILTALLPSTEVLKNIVIHTGTRLAEAFSCGVTLATFYGLKRSQGQALEPLPDSAG